MKNGWQLKLPAVRFHANWLRLPMAAAVTSATTMESTASTVGCPAMEPASSAADCPAAEAASTMEAIMADEAAATIVAAVAPAPAWPIKSAAVAMEPRAGTDEDAVNEPIRPIVSVGRACVGGIRVVTVGAYWRRPDSNGDWANSDAYAHSHLRIRSARWNE